MTSNLATRAAGAAAQQANGGRPTVAQLIEQLTPQMARALPKHMDADRMTRIALTVIRQTPGLARCEPNSLLGALMTASQLGLEPGPLGEAYLVPYGNQVTFIPGYRGLIKLAWQSGQVKSIDAHVVHEHDDFTYEYGLTPTLRHIPTRGEPGKATEVYAVATMHNGGSAFVVMSLADVEAIRKRSKASRNGPWVTDWEAMAKKTAIKQLIRFLPLSAELRTLNEAARADETVRTDVAHPVDEADMDWIDAEPADTDDTPEPEPMPAAEEQGELIP